jgi:serine/threonine-protein kinase OSR1/STK39
MADVGDLPVTASEWPNNADGYQLTTRIGHGAFATVHKAIVKSGTKASSEVAIKIIELEEFADSSLEEIRRELQMMRMCRHENVIAYHVAFPAKRQMWLVMPLLAGGSCANVMRTRNSTGGFEDEAVIAYILRETAKAIKYFHDNMQIHRDLKAGNILLGGDAEVFLSDFGVAAPLRDDKKRQTFVGTPCWMAPEVLEQSGGYDYKADVWSYGITAIELAYGEAPYQRLHPLKVMKIIIEKDPPRIDRRKWGAEFVSLVEYCLQKDPKKRPTMDEIFNKHKKFFAKANQQPLIDILRSLPAMEQRIPPKPSWSSSKPGVFAAFGHHHIGLTGGAKTGRLVADMITKNHTNCDMRPFEPTRFAVGN